MEEKLYEHAQTSTLTSRYLGFVGNRCTFTVIFSPQRIFSHFIFCDCESYKLTTCFGEYVHYSTENVCVFHHHCSSSLQKKATNNGIKFFTLKN